MSVKVAIEILLASPKEIPQANSSQKPSNTFQSNIKSEIEQINKPLKYRTILGKSSHDSRERRLTAAKGRFKGSTTKNQTKDSQYRNKDVFSYVLCFPISEWQPPNSSDNFNDTKLESQTESGATKSFMNETTARTLKLKTEPVTDDIEVQFASSKIKACKKQVDITIIFVKSPNLK